MPAMHKCNLQVSGHICSNRLELLLFISALIIGKKADNACQVNRFTVPAESFCRAGMKRPPQ